MIAIALGLASSVCWGLADFFGGLQSRRFAVLGVLLLSQVPALAGVVTIVALAGGTAPDDGALAAAAASGACGVIALAAFYRALAIGTMSIVAPITAMSAAVPVVVGLATGDDPGAVTLAGIAVAVGGVVLAVREPDAASRAAERARLSVVLALVAALGFGGFLVGIRDAAETDVFWALMAARAMSVSLLVAAFVVARPALPVGGRHVGAVVVIGVLDLSANGLYAAATREGLLSVVGVLGSVYPAVTVLLARSVLGERLSPAQQAGVVGVLAGVGLIAAG